MTTIIVAFSLLGLLFILLTQHFTEQYQYEVEQKLHVNLAQHLVNDDPALKAGIIQKEQLKTSFQTMMILGPSFEFYVVDTHGNLLTHAAPPGRIKRQQINVEPITRFLEQREPLPILGEDPRSENNKKIFSAAEIYDKEHLIGYLYIIIGGEIYDSVVDLLENSHIMEIGFSFILVGLIFSLILVLIIFAIITRPIQRLTDDMDALKKEGFESHKVSLSHWKYSSHDEIHQLGTTFRLLTEELKKQYQAIKTTDQLRKELLSYISHDFRTPLASLQGYLETWQMKSEHLSKEESRHYIDVALKNAKHMHRLVEQLFELAYLDGNQVELHKEPIVIAELAQDVIQKFSLKAQQKGIILKLPPQDANIVCVVDIEKMERVFSNLIDNAIRHCRPGDTVCIDFSQEHHNNIIKIKDTGIGIDKNDLTQLFEPHFKAKNSQSDNKPTSGLGLAITRRLLELHSGSISVSSQLGEGTTFAISLPQAA
ncbi:MAG: HAMP domain-containing sensor histidine kinase [Pseudomonadota bacterium]